MSETMTRIRIRGKGGRYGLLEYGEKTHAEMLSAIRSYAQSELDRAQLILSTPNDWFEVAVVKGKIVQHLIKDVSPE